MKVAATSICLLASLGFVPALADIWECVDAEGSKRFTNIKAEADKLGCKQLKLAPPQELEKAYAARAKQLAAEQKARDGARIGMTKEQAIAARLGQARQDQQNQNGIRHV
jgi:Domain of unknown function (DUF4124)